jgi:predicted RNase H-like nuclease (RuvC/YqgF family)
LQLKRIAVELQNKLKTMEKERDQSLKKEKKLEKAASKSDLKLFQRLNDMIGAVDALKGTINDADDKLIDP